MGSLIQLSRALGQQANRLRFGSPVAYVYNPLEYAWDPHLQYLRRYGAGRGRVLLLGMNPGPFGMAQTGVPFGDVTMVRDFLGIEGPVDCPVRTHPSRPVEGFACRRREVSGTRLWGFAEKHWLSSEAFFETFFVANWCPLAFVDPKGRNVTPDKLAANDRAELFEVCDRALLALLRVLKPAMVIGVGRFSSERARSVSLGLPVATILHPSPASPAANADWAGDTARRLTALGITLPFPSK